MPEWSDSDFHVEQGEPTSHHHVGQNDPVDKVFKRALSLEQRTVASHLDDDRQEAKRLADEL